MADHFDPEPTTELAPDEPNTPLWLPAVGLALFLAVGGVWLGVGESTPAAEAPVATSPEKVAPNPSERDAAAAAPEKAAPTRPAGLDRPGAPGGLKLPHDALERLRAAREARKQKMQEQAAGEAAGQ